MALRQKSRQNSSVVALGGTAGLTTPKLARLAGEVKAARTAAGEALALCEAALWAYGVRGPTTLAAGDAEASPKVLG
jgi:hypothetical protein